MRPWYKSFYTVFVIGPLIVIQDLVLSNHDYIPKMVFLTVSAILIFTYIRDSRTGSSIRQTKKGNYLELLFLIFIAYVSLQSMRVIFFGHSRAGALYWPVQFMIILAIAYFQNQKSLISETKQANSQTISIYQWLLLFYLSLGRLLLEIDSQRIKLLNFEVTSKTMLLIPVLIFYPMILNALLRGTSQQKLRSSLILILYIQIGILITDRAVIMSTLILLVCSIPYIYTQRPKVFGTFFTYCFAIFVVFMVLVQPNKSITGTLISDTSGIITDIPKVSSVNGSGGEGVNGSGGEEASKIHDLDRFVHLEAAWRTVSNDPFHLVFGFGFREDSFVMQKELEDLYRKKLPGLDITKELGPNSNFITFGLAAFLVDFGILGVAMSVLFGFFLVLRLIKGIKPSWSLVIISTLALTILYLFKVNFLHYPLLYFAVSPAGLFVWMASLQDRSTYAKEIVYE
jgi:hypothetical protein